MDINQNSNKKDGAPQIGRKLDNEEELVLPPEVWASVMECTYQYIIKHFTCVPRPSYLTSVSVIYTFLFTSTFYFGIIVWINRSTI